MVGEETSSAVFQIVQIVPTVKADFPKMQEAKEGAEIILTAKVDGSPPPTAVWLLEGEEIQADGERVIITVEEDEDGGLGFTTTLRITKVHFFLKKNSLDAGIQDRSTSISIVVKFEQRLLKKEKEMVMKVTNIYKHEIVDTRA